MKLRAKNSGQILNFGFFKIAGGALLLSLCAACASGPAAEEDPLEEELTPTAATKSAPTGNPLDAPANAAPSPNASLVYFFAKGNAGVEVEHIAWDKPLSSENPGADCELRSRRPGNFACVVRNNDEAVVLTVTEAQTRAGRVITRVAMDGKGVAQRERWTTELRAHGYEPAGEKPGRAISRQSFRREGPHATQADVIWVAAKKAVTVIFRPAPVVVPVKSPGQAPGQTPGKGAGKSAP